MLINLLIMNVPPTPMPHLTVITGLYWTLRFVFDS